MYDRGELVTVSVQSLWYSVHPHRCKDSPRFGGQRSPAVFAPSGDSTQQQLELHLSELPKRPAHTEKAGEAEAKVRTRNGTGPKWPRGILPSSASLGAEQSRFPELPDADVPFARRKLRVTSTDVCETLSSFQTLLFVMVIAASWGRTAYLQLCSFLWARCGVL